MSESRYSVTVRQLASGSWEWTISTVDSEAFPLYENIGGGMTYNRAEVSGKRRSFARAAREAADEVGQYVKRDIEAELVDSFESNVPIAQAGSS